MVELLEKLLEEKKYTEAMAVAEELIKTPNCDRKTLLTAQMALAQARGMLGEHDGVVHAATAARELAMALQEWDGYGTACTLVAVAYANLQQFDQTISLLREFFSKVDRYVTAMQYEVGNWYIMGFSYTKTGRKNDAAEAYASALRAADRRGTARIAHGIRQGIMEQYLQFGEVSRVPELLAKCGQYLRNNRNAADWGTSKSYHEELRGDFAFKTGRYHRALPIGLRGVHSSKVTHLNSVLFHLALSRLAVKMEEPQVALGHALAAQVYARRGGLMDLEQSATEAVYTITQSNPGVRAITDWAEARVGVAE